MGVIHGMKTVRLGIIGIGGMGSYHADYLREGKVHRATLAAVCDIDPPKLDKYKDIPSFARSAEMIRSGLVDAVIVATPHYGHTTIGIDALNNSLHTLVEKPISVHVADCQRLIAAARAHRKLVFGAMFNQRTDPHYARVRALVQSGELGTIQRVNWIITNWFRTNAYYASGGWRATWRGEGGGVLLNQCPHNLDLLQWICGMPRKVTAFCSLGKYHPIEVEDEVTAYLEYANGATGVFVTTTGEAPGTNRFEITGDCGKVVIENSAITFTRNTTPAREFCKTSPHSFAAPDVWNVSVPVSGGGGQHAEITQNFVNAILDKKPLLAPGVEGIHSVELANAMLYSSLTRSTVELPLDAAAFEKQLKKLIARSRFKKPAAKGKVADLSASFAK